MRRHRALLAAIAAIGIGCASGPAAASGTEHPAAKPSPATGYIYAGTIASGLQTLAVHADHTVTLARTIPSPGGAIGGVTLLHTKAGIKLYVMAGVFGSKQSIYTYSVNESSGKLTLSSKPPIQNVLAGQRGNNLYSWDGQGHNPDFDDALYAETCVASNCSTYGLGFYKVNLNTGALTLAETPSAATLNWVSVQDDRMAILVPENPGDAIEPIAINHETGTFATGGLYILSTNDQPKLPAYADMVGAGPYGVAAGNIDLGGQTIGPSISVLHSTGGTHLSSPAAISSDGTPSAMALLAHIVVVGEAGPTDGPQLQLIAPSGLTEDGVVDLTKAPYKLGSGSSFDPDFVETIYQLGQGVYFGVYGDPLVQGTYGVNGHGLELNQKHPTVSNLGTITSMAGFLLPTKTATTLSVGKKNSKLNVTGRVNNGVNGGAVDVTLYSRKNLGPWIKRAHHIVGLTNTQHFSTSFTRVGQPHCRVKAAYAGNKTTAPSSASVTFSC